MLSSFNNPNIEFITWMTFFYKNTKFDILTLLVLINSFPCNHSEGKLKYLSLKTDLKAS